jgi:hypothetical protein
VARRAVVCGLGLALNRSALALRLPQRAGPAEQLGETIGKPGWEQPHLMRREEVTERVVNAKTSKGLSWSSLAKAAGRSEVWTTSALLGQQAMS